MVLSSSENKKTRRFALAYVVPALLVIGFVFWPVVRGDRTLFFRDVFNTHLEMKWVQAEAMRAGDMPLVDPYRAGGQPHLGNPNTVALYPDNLLYLVASPIWALNAHFWLHLLVAPFTFFWLARAWGASREGSWAGGVTFAASGYVLSCLNLYNLIAPVVWAPALAAACLHLVSTPSPRRALWRPAAVWALLVLGGDPITAVLALVLAALLVVARDGFRAPRWGWLIASIGLGTMLAAPLVLEFVRILSLSFRGHWGYSLDAATAGSWHPIRFAEWLLPLAFGRPDLLYWGQRFHGGFPPLLYSLAPGIVALTLALLGLGGRPRLRWWSLGLIAAGFFVALGQLNPLVAALLQAPGGDLLRMPIKAYLFVAVGVSLLASIGFERLCEEGGAGRLARALAGVGAVYLAIWILLVLAGRRFEELFRTWMPSNLVAGGLAETERLRWAGLALLSVLLIVALLAATWWLRRRPGWLGALLVVTQVTAQLFFLRPLYELDETSAYLEPSPVEQAVPLGALVVHGVAENLFEESSIPIHLYPDSSSRWLHRQIVREFYPHVGEMRGRRFEFDMSPEGLDSFLTRAASQVLRQLSDQQRVRLLASSGVEWLILKRDLDPELVASGAVELVASFEALADDLRVYRILDTAPEYAFIGTIHSSETLNDAVEKLVGAGFDPRREAILAGEPAAGDGQSGEVRVLAATPERMLLEVEAPGAGALLVQRAHLPLYRARVDGRRAPLYVANLHRMAVVLETGRHTVEIWVDQTRWWLGLGLAFVALVILGVLAREPAGARRGDAGVE